MSYPEKGANYDHTPRFLDRMKRAEGGATDTPMQSVGVPASPEDRAMLNADLPLTQDRANQIYDAYERVGGGQDVSNNQFVKNSQFGISPLSGLSAVRMPTIGGVDTGDKMDADTSDVMPKFLRGLRPKRHGGKVRKGD